MACTTGGPFESCSAQGCHRYPFESFIPPFRQTAEFCRMRRLPPFILHGAQRITDGALAEAVALYRRRLIDYPGGASAMEHLGVAVAIAEDRAAREREREQGGWD